MSSSVSVVAMGTGHVFCSVDSNILERGTGWYWVCFGSVAFSHFCYFGDPAASWHTVRFIILEKKRRVGITTTWERGDLSYSAVHLCSREKRRQEILSQFCDHRNMYEAFQFQFLLLF